MKTLKPNDRRGKIAKTFLLILIVVKLACIFADYIQYNLLSDIANGEYVSEDEANRSDIIQMIVYILNLIVSIISIVFFIRWFRRAYYNLHTIVGGLKHSEGWATGGWFVPIANFYIPYGIMREIYTETAKFIRYKKEDTDFKLETSWLIWWWIVWILSGLLSFFVARLIGKEDNLVQLLDNTIFTMVDEAVSIISIVLTLIVMTDYQEVEPLLLEIEDTDNEPQVLIEMTE